MEVREDQEASFWRWEVDGRMQKQGEEMGQGVFCGLVERGEMCFWQSAEHAVG